MGLMVDTNVFIRFEKSARGIDLSPWGQAEQVYVSAVTVSELLMGVHRANTEERRQRRSVFVEAVIAGVGVLDFTLGAARVHAELTSWGRHPARQPFRAHPRHIDPEPRPHHRDGALRGPEPNGALR